MNKRVTGAAAGAIDSFLPEPAFFSKSAPCRDWTAMSASDHFVQFYESDDFLIDSLAGFIGAGLDQGDTCIVVATPGHGRSLDARLTALGHDTASTEVSGRYIFLDASATLNSIITNGYVDDAAFGRVVGELVERLTAGGKRVRIFGEMVALLWAKNNQDAAIRLEEMWNGLGHAHAFSLFCAYPMKGLYGEKHVGPLAKVCGCHSHVIPAESYSSLIDEDDRLREIAMLQQKAQSLEAEIAERERASRLKDEFLATVSHELRTPLNAIVGWATLLQKEVLDDETARRAIDTIERSARAQTQMVEDMLDISQITTGRLQLKFESIDLASVISAALNAVQQAAESKKITLGVTVDPCARHIAGDADRLRQMIWNLLSNAVKFTPRGGRVDVSVKRGESDLVFEVQDTGCGINADFLPFIFDLFRQEDGSGTRRNGGLGLGLAIVRNVAELHGGSIRAESPGEGQGATFTLRLPAS